MRKPAAKKKILALVGIGVVMLGLGSGAWATLGGAMQPSASQVALNKGLVDWLKMDGNAKDSSPYRNNGTISGATLTTDRKAKANSAYNFDGVSNYMSVADATNMKSGSVTVSFWYTQTSTLDCDGNNNYRIVANKSSSTSGWSIMQEEGGGMTFRVYWGGVEHRTPYGVNMGLVVGTPTLLTFTYDATSGVMNAYAGMVNKYTTTFGSPQAIDWTLGATMYLAKGGNAVSCPNGNGYAPAVMDDFRVYSRALSASEEGMLTSQYNPAVKADSGDKGLVGWWPLDGNAKDSTPMRNNGTVSGPTLTADRKGRANAAYAFDGSVPQRITLSNAGPYNSFGTNSFTISAWIKTSESLAQRCIFSTASNAKGIRFGYQSGLPYYLVGDGTNYNEAAIGSTTLNDGNWHHLAMTFIYTSNWTVTAYIDGNSTGSASLSALIGSVSGGAVSVIGTMSTGGSNGAVTGSIDDVRTYSRALAPAEITTLAKSYNSQIGLGGSEDTTGINISRGLVGDWSLNGNAKDATPFRNAGTITAATLTTDRKGRANSAYSFDGSTSFINVGNGSNLNIAGPVTVSAWINPVANAGQQYGIFGSSAGWNTAYSMYIRNSAGADLAFATNPSGTNYARTGGTLTYGSWNHVVGTWDGSTILLYVNGSLASMNGQATSSVTRNFAAMYIGRLPGLSAPTYFNGPIDDVRIWNRALTAAEVAAVYAEYR